MKSSPAKVKLIILTSLAIAALLLFPRPASADSGDPKGCGDWNEWYGISGTQNASGEFTGPVTLSMVSNCPRVMVFKFIVDDRLVYDPERNGNDPEYYTINSDGPHTIIFLFDTGAGAQIYGPFNIKINIYQPPSISGSLACSQWGENGWCVGSETLELSASDPQGKTVMISGDVAGTAFACPSGDTSCSIPLPNGSGSINYRVTSQTNLTASGTTSWSLDSGLPQISGALSGSSGKNDWFISSVLLSASASDSTSGMALLEYSNDSATWTPYALPIALSDGIYTVSLRARDNAGNQKSVTQSVKIDSVTPNLNLGLAGTPGLNGWYKTNVQGTASGNDSGSGLANIEYSLDGGAWTNYTGALTLSDGAHSLSVRATDAAGNVTQAAQQINVDTITPLINLSVNGTAGAGGWYVSDIKVSASGSDNGAGLASLEYSLNNGAWTPFTSTLPYSEGQTSLKFRAIDKAGNTTTTPVQTFSIDKTPPVIDMPSAWNLGSTESYKITDGGSGVAGVRVVIQDQHERYPKVAWDDGETGPTFAGEIFWDGRFADGTIAPAGDYFVTLKAHDRAGNESTKAGVITVENSLLTYLILPSTRQSSNPAPLLNTIQPSITTDFGGDSNDESTDSQTNATDVGGVLTSAAEIAGTTSLVLTTAGRVEVFGADSSSANAGSLPSSQTNGILWGGLAAAAIGAFTADAVRKKEEEAEAARKWWAEQVAMNKQMSTGSGDDNGGGMTYKQIGQAYQAALRNFKTQLQNNGLSPKQASALQSQAIKNGSISSVLGAAQEAMDAKKKERKEQLNKLIAKNLDDTPIDMNKVNQLVEQAKAQKEQPIAKQKQSAWDKTIEWIDNHQAVIALGLGIAVGAAAIVISGGAAAPLVVLAWAGLAAGAMAVGGTVALNAHYSRPLGTNVVKNLLIAGGTAAATVFIFGGSMTMGLIKLGNSVTGYCISNPAACSRFDWALNAVDTGEQLYLQGKLAYQTAIGDQAGAADTSLELQMESMDGGMPGNTVAKGLSNEAIEIIARYGDDASELILKYGDDAVDIIGTYGDDGLRLLQAHGDDAVEIIEKYGEDGANLLTKYGNEVTPLLKQGIPSSQKWTDYVPKDIQDDIRSTFDGAPIPITLSQDVKVYRYWSGDGRTELGRWVTLDPNLTPDEARKLLALPDSNLAINVTEFTIPADTTIFLGETAGQTSASWAGTYAIGGGFQVYLPDPSILVKNK